jgi:uncharacterized integral membrane protein
MGIIRTIFVYALVFALLLTGAALAIFIWSNFDQRVVIYFTDYFRTFELPLSAALVGALVIGFLFSFILSIPNQFRLRGRVRDHRRKIEKLESEIAELRKLPLSDVDLSKALPDSPDPGSTDGP